MSRLTVLNTRPREQAEELSRLLREAGFSVAEAPAIAIVPALEASLLAAIRQDLAARRFDWVVLASTNAGRQLADDLREGSTPIVCGTATAEALNLKPTVGLNRFSASAALSALASELRTGQRVLAPRAAEGRDELLGGLAALGIEVTAPVAYRTIPVDDAAERLRAGGIDVVALCSPSAVVSVAAAIGEARVVCLGATTAAEATKVGVRVDAVAQATSMVALAEAIESLAEMRV
jgi:uroporphyrinogen-III synthase